MENFIKQELEEIAPFLGRIRKVAQAQLGPLPEGYFEQFEYSLEQRLEVDQELEKLAPKLAELEKPSLGKLPKGYFIQFGKSLKEYLEVEEELEELAPRLARLEKPSLGELPEGYFEQFGEKLKGKLESLEEERIETSILDQLKKTQQGLPAGYFDNFESRLMDRIAEESEEKETEKVKLVKMQEPKAWWQKSAGVMSIAASFLLLVLAGTWWIRGEFKSPYHKSLAMNIEMELQQLRLAEANDYILQNIDELDTEDFAEQLDETEIELLGQEQRTSFMPILSDTTPPKAPVKKMDDPEEIESKVTQIPKEDKMDFQTELEEEALEETDLEELTSDFSEDDFAALEAALLKPKKPTIKENKIPKSNK